MLHNVRQKALSWVFWARASTDPLQSFVIISPADEEAALSGVPASSLQLSRIFCNDERRHLQIQGGVS